MSIESVFLTLIAQADANGDTAGALALRTAHEQMPSTYSEWLDLSASSYPPTDRTIDLALQRYAPGQAGDIERRIVRGCRVYYPRNNYDNPVYTDSNNDAVEVDGWYTTRFAYPLENADVVPHNEP